MNAVAARAGHITVFGADELGAAHIVAAAMAKVTVVAHPAEALWAHRVAIVLAIGDHRPAVVTINRASL